MLKKTNLLYLILDREFIQKKGQNIYRIAETAAKNGIDFLQYRFKDIPTITALSQAKKINRIISQLKTNTRLIINDRVDIARAVNSNGVHLGETDLPSNEARKILDRRIIIGKTVHDKRELKKASNEPVDYIGIGPVFKTRAKPYLKPLGIKKAKELTKGTKKLSFLIGGITKENLPDLKKEGFNNFAVCRGILAQKNIEKAIINFKAIIDNNG